jgi:hypothetical protein
VFVVRLAALAAVVVSAGGTALSLAHIVRADAEPLLQWIVTACGALVVVSLFVMKFVGPPPRSFVPRAALAFALTVVSATAAVLPRFVPAVDTYMPGITTLLWVELALGLALLTWYAREQAG